MSLKRVALGIFIGVIWLWIGIVLMIQMQWQKDFIAVWFVLLAIPIIYFYGPAASYTYLRKRDLDKERWKKLYSTDEVPIVDSVIQCIVDAFLLRSGDAFRLKPTDRLSEIYHAAYPNNWADALEYETLVSLLNDEFQISINEFEKLDDPTVEDIISLCLSKQPI